MVNSVQKNNKPWNNFHLNVIEALNQAGLSVADLRFPNERTVIIPLPGPNETVHITDSTPDLRRGHINAYLVRTGTPCEEMLNPERIDFAPEVKILISKIANRLRNLLGLKEV